MQSLTRCAIQNSRIAGTISGYRDGRFGGTPRVGARPHGAEHGMLGIICAVEQDGQQQPLVGTAEIAERAPSVDGRAVVALHHTGGIGAAMDPKIGVAARSV